jgi:hypothetical protein
VNESYEVNFKKYAKRKAAAACPQCSEPTEMPGKPCAWCRNLEDRVAVREPTRNRAQWEWHGNDSGWVQIG